MPTVVRMLRDASSIRVYCELAGKEERLDISPIEKDGTVLLSLKDIKKGFGTIVQYAQADGKLVFRGERGTTELQVPDRMVQSIDGEYYIPLPILASAMGYDYTVKDKEVHIRVGPDKVPAPPAPTFALATPYVNAADIRSIAWVYSEKNADQPWGFMTNDMRLLPDAQFAAFQVPADGAVEEVHIGENKECEYNKIARIVIRLDSNYVARYVFNHASAFPQELDVQQSNIFVKQGQKVKQGETVGRLYHLNVSSNVSFALIYAEEGTGADYSAVDGLQFVSPEPYFTTEARQSLLGVLNKDHAGRKLSYLTPPALGDQVCVFKDNIRMQSDHECVIKDGELLVPFTALAQIGAEPSYNEKTKEVTARFSTHTVSVPVQTIEKVTYVPLRPFMEGFGLSYKLERNVASLSAKGYGGEHNRVTARFDGSPCSFHDSALTFADGYFYIGSTAWDQFSHADNRIFKLDASLNKVWEFPMGSLSTPSAVCSDSKGNVYFVAVEQLAEFDPNNKFTPAAHHLYSLTGGGEFRWKCQISDQYTMGGGGGLIGCAVSKDDVIYVGSGGLYAFDVDGNILWHYAGATASSRMSSNTAPITDAAGNVYFVGSDFSLSTQRETQERVFCFEPGSGGKPRWATPIKNGMLGGENSVAGSSPALTGDGKRIIVVTGDTVHSLDTTTGRLEWQLKPFEGFRGIFQASPILDDRDNIYVNTKCDDTSTIYAIKADGSGLLWETNKVGSDLYCTGALGDDGALYIASEPQTSSWFTFHAIDLATGEIRWQIGSREIPMVNLTNVIIKDGYAYVAANAPQNAYVVKVKVDAEGYLKNAAWPCYRGSSDNTGRGGR